MPPEAEPLRLRAEDADDLAVISACLQDAIVSVRDLAYDRKARSFMLVTNRFRWESGAEPAGADQPPFERTLCGLAFDNVEAVAYRGFHRNEENRILCLLAIRPTIDGAVGTIDLEFAAGVTVRLKVSGVRCWVRDLGEPWPTAWHPEHATDEPK